MFSGMGKLATDTGFVARLNEVCDDMKLPAKHGRQTALAKVFGVTQGATKKWLSGTSWPGFDHIVAICEWAGVNVNWLVMGAGPKRNDVVETKVLVLGEALESMSQPDREQVLDFLAFKFEKSADLFVGERLARYMTMIDAFKKDRDGLR
jgi:transcriptional regulator with XRE-family HTH domain